MQVHGNVADQELVARARAGCSDSLASLYRLYQPTALRYARTCCRSLDDAEDLVAAAFESVFGAISGGGGPNTAFRPYLLQTVRNHAIRSARRSSKSIPVETIDDAVDPTFAEGSDATAAVFERAAVARAFTALPLRWRQALWHGEIEGNPPRVLARLLGLRSANSAAALTYRAREGLRQEYLRQHIAEGPAECEPYLKLLGRFVRHSLAEPDRQALIDHMDMCERCSCAYAEVSDLDSTLRRTFLPIPAMAQSTCRPRRWRPRRGSSAPRLLAATAVSAAIALVLGVQSRNGPSMASAEVSPADVSSSGTSENHLGARQIGGTKPLAPGADPLAAGSDPASSALRRANSAPPVTDRSSAPDLRTADPGSADPGINIRIAWSEAQDTDSVSPALDIFVVNTRAESADNVTIVLDSVLLGIHPETIDGWACRSDAEFVRTTCTTTSVKPGTSTFSINPASSVPDEHQSHAQDPAASATIDATSSVHGRAPTSGSLDAVVRSPT